MNLRQLEYLAMLAETLNFHAAARRLNVSQPPLSVAIKKLEEELGVTLFDRNKRDVRLSAVGEAVLKPALEALAQTELVRAAARQGAKGEVGELTIGFVGSAIGEQLPRIISNFRARYANVRLILKEMTSVDVAVEINARRLSVGLVRLPMMRQKSLEIHVIERDELVLALPRSHRLARRKCLKLAELAEEPFIIHAPVSTLHWTVLLACQKAGFAPLVTQQAIQVQTILCLVQSGLGISLVPARMARVHSRHRANDPSARSHHDRDGHCLSRGCRPPRTELRRNSHALR